MAKLKTPSGRTRGRKPSRPPVEPHTVYLDRTTWDYLNGHIYSASASVRELVRDKMERIEMEKRGAAK